MSADCDGERAQRATFRGIGNYLDWTFFSDPIGRRRCLAATKSRLGDNMKSSRVINVDGHPAYPQAIAELKANGELGRRCRCRPIPYLNNVLEQDHRFIKKRIAASLGFRSSRSYCFSLRPFATHPDSDQRAFRPAHQEGGRSFSAP
jgi:hypothetical protein